MRRKDFPIFQKHKKLVYLDSAATAQKPRSVIEAMRNFLAQENAPVHRSMYPLGEKATQRFEEIRKSAARFIHAFSPDEIIFIRNATEGLNLVAQTWGRVNVKRGEEILITRMEHHANFVPWQMLAKERGARLRIVELTHDGHIDLRDFQKKLTRRTKIVAVAHVSNVLGTINPVKEIVRTVRRKSASLRRHQFPIVVVDAAQSAPHLPISVRAIGCDFLVFSGHKLYGPTGVGVLWGRKALLEHMPPFLTGGQMIRTVSDTETEWEEPPQRFEAGTSDIAGVISLGAAIDYLNHIGWQEIVRHERVLMSYALRRFADPKIRRFVKVYGPKHASERTGSIAFTVHGVHPHDAASLLAEEGISVRAGHHCAMPLHTCLGVPATVRLSFGLYNDKTDVDRFFDALKRRVLILV